MMVVTRHKIAIYFFNGSLSVLGQTCCVHFIIHVIASYCLLKFYLLHCFVMLWFVDCCKHCELFCLTAGIFLLFQVDVFMDQCYKFLYVHGSMYWVKYSDFCDLLLLLVVILILIFNIVWCLHLIFKYQWCLYWSFGVGNYSGKVLWRVDIFCMK